MSDERQSSGEPLAADDVWSTDTGPVTSLPWRSDLALPAPRSTITIAGSDAGGTTLATTYTVLDARRSRREDWIDVRLEGPSPE